MSDFFKSKKYKLFYFWIQLPLAIMGIKGYDLLQGCGQPKPAEYTIPTNGTYELQNINNGDFSGTITISNSQNNMFECAITGDEISIFDYIQNSEVKCGPFICESVVMTDDKIYGDTFWYCKRNDLYIVITKIVTYNENDYFNNIYMDVKKHSNYILFVLSEEIFKEINSSIASSNVQKSLLLKMTVSVYSGYFKIE